MMALVEVVAHVTLSQVIEELETAYDEYCHEGKGDKPDEWEDYSFESVKEYTQEKELEVVGSGAVRPDSNIEEVDIAKLVMDMSGTRKSDVNLPDIYSKYGAQKRLMAKRIAQVDAYRKLAERINGLKISSTTTVADFMNVNDQICSSVNAFIKGARPGRSTLSARRYSRSSGECNPGTGNSDT